MPVRILEIEHLGRGRPAINEKSYLLESLYYGCTLEALRVGAVMGQAPKTIEKTVG